MWRRPTLDDWIILACGTLLLVDSFAPWYFTDVGGTVDQRNAWHGPGLAFAVVAVLAGVALTALVVLRLRSTRDTFRPDRMRAAALYLAGGVVAFVAVIARMRAGTDEGSWGLYLALLLAGGLLLGGLGHWRTAGGRWPGTARAADAPQLPSDSRR